MSLGSKALDASLDRWLTTPPEDSERSSNLKCSMCGNDIYLDEDYYVIEDDNMCEDCAREWLDEHRKTADYEDCYDG